VARRTGSDCRSREGRRDAREAALTVRASVPPYGKPTPATNRGDKRQVVGDHGRGDQQAHARGPCEHTPRACSGSNAQLPPNDGVGWLPRDRGRIRTHGHVRPPLDATELGGLMSAPDCALIGAIIPLPVESGIKAPYPVVGGLGGTRSG
jgi:hypothetical protein